jgi:eukaryotic-like serine/threonine-protein kinase
MTPGNKKKCRQCGVVSDARVLSGLCPNCLLKQGLKGPPAEGIETFEPPSLESLAKVMRGIFEPIEFIGRGGMGAVFKGRQCSLNRIVALKVMQPRAADRGSIIHGFQRFKREAQSLARLSHRNVVGVYDFELAGDFLYFTMDFVDGPSLRQMLLKSGPLNPSHAVTLFLQLCDGLQHAHQSRVIHRDVKPENLLVDEGGVLKIVDFGLAKLNGAGASNEWKTLDNNRRMGTPHYMAPEQVEKPQAVDHRADIYSAGVVLYEMLTGELPLGRFSAPSQKANVDSSLDTVLFRALEKDLTRRYQDIREFKRAVVAALCWGDLGHGSKSFRDMPETYRRAA